MKNQMTAVSAIIVSFLLVACENQNVSISDGFGNSVRQNMAAHIINPAPVYEAGSVPATDGARTAGALERYRTGEVTALEEVATSDLGESN